ncbi:alpha,alpha-trehalase treA [Aspergillus clavatus NRRL 1]|uniref:alpha,alpha-trehalase n=1 Tax=Aspergillus clavatus (strain ATCC 1007 / CBS 513.65 / DSM 816 / NCTC 3887 / NRRL 1 / QM 1276 / 107) TaxID=344612 RepID=A1CCI1_ASPCL|nr:glycosyl hydrolase family 65 protein [Aspergillus clavatus NRRL 1]EAW12238.1 glycosyl hydrolase family 65 protein [Aspergillus clavatus NRRL 1]
MLSTNLATWASLLACLPATLAFQTNNHARVTRSLKRHAGHGHTPPTDTNSSNIYETRFPGVTWDNDNWVLATTTLDQGHYQSRGSVANGYLGINVASVGPFFELDTPVSGDVINGWPLFSRRQSFATIAGFFDFQPTTNGSNFPWLNQYGGESVISGVPHWSGLVLDLGDDTYLDAAVDNETISGFQSAYDFKSGVLSWSYTWTPTDDKGSFNITYRLFANKLHINQAVVDMEITPSQESQATVVNVIDGYSAVRTDFVESGEDDGAIFSAVRPWGIANVTAYVYANLTASKNVDLASHTLVADKPYIHTNESSVAQAVRVNFRANETVRITKFVGAASSDAFPDPQKTAKQAVSAALGAGYMESLQSHVAEWADILLDGSVDSFVDPVTGKLPDDEHIVNSQVIAVANTYYLLQNTVGKNATTAVSDAPVNVDSISVGGLTSDSYAGQVFWDADVWMQPGLVASHPEAAQRITNFRVVQYQQALENVNTAFTGSKNQTSFSPSAAIYPWTSGRFGNCTGTGPCWDYQYHLNGDIGLSLMYQWITSGDTKVFREQHFPIYDSIATLYSNLVERNGSSWTLTNMTDPDEYANHIDAGGFTMPLISETLGYANTFRKQFGHEQNETWSKIAENVLVIRENDVTLEYTTMNGTTVVKQADVVLVTYPLVYDNNYTSEYSLNDLDFYANKQSPDGPAMTWAIFAITANDVSPSGCSAYTYHQNSYDPYMRAPFFQLSEQTIDDASINGGTHPAYPFLTGHGGANQVVLFGYLGLRLLPDDAIHIDPNLPPQIPNVAYRTFYWHGWPISASSNRTHTTISRATKIAPLDTADPRFANVSIPVLVGYDTNATAYHLPPSGPLTVRNRQIGLNNTIPGNIIQCRPVYSPDDYAPGQFPIAAVDGATSTKWQPATTNTSALTVTLPDAEVNSVVSGFHFDWWQAPPVNATVIFHDETLEDPVTALSSSHGNPQYTVITTLTNIELSQPYNAESSDLNKVAMPTGNTTDVQLSSTVHAARYATLLISGSQGDGDAGATVAEWAILGQEKESSGHDNGKRRLDVRSAAALSGSLDDRRARRFTA